MSKRKYYGHELLHCFVNAAGQWQDIDEKSRNFVAEALNKTATNVRSDFVVVPRHGHFSIEFDSTKLGHLIVVSGSGFDCRWLSHELTYEAGKLHIPVASFSQDNDQITVTLGSKKIWQGQVVIAPDSAIEPPKSRLWGPAVQLYSLRQEDDWGIGDFSALNALIDILAPYNPGFIGLNPLHALSLAAPEMASPYSPGDRAWLNIAYIDPDATLFADEIKQWRDRPGTAERRQKLVDEPFIDYPGVLRIKWQALARQFRAAEQSKHWVDFEQWRAQQGDILQSYAMHEASSLQSKKGQPKPRLVSFIAFCQWLAIAQLSAAQEKCRAHRMPVGLYIDLAVGCVGNGAEGQRRHKQLVHGLDMGAPPDPFGPTGQVWGMPITHPDALETTKGQDFIDLMSANMALGGALRIDHAMGLMRIWAVPSGASATQGAYVNYDFSSHVALLNMVSQAQNCIIVAEDLGTVPDEVRQCFPKQNYLSMQVLLYEREGERLPTYSAVKKQALAVLSSHDMPPLACYWRGGDIGLRKQLGLLNERQAHEQYQQRQHARWVLSNTVGYHNEDWDEELLVRLHEYLAASPAQWVSIQLEDLLFEEQPVNIPGTTETQYPNWRRRLNKAVDELTEKRAAQRVLQILATERPY